MTTTRRFTLEGQGETLHFVSEPEDPAGICELEVTMAPGADGPPTHYHLGQAETFIGVRGRLRLRVGGEEHLLEPGNQVVVPSGVPHTFRNDLAEEPAQFLVRMEPALAFPWALGEMARSAIRGGGSWDRASLLEIGWILHQVRGEYYGIAGLPRPLHHALTATLAGLARLTGRHRNVAPRP
jgi:quercetin dioxygenase-like cupin family protein